MGNNWQTSDDDLSGFPSAASPLSAMGIDPDEARANPDLMARLTGRSNPSSAQARLAAGPGGTLPADPHATRSAVIAATSGGAGDTSTPSAPSVPATAHGYGMEGLGALTMMPTIFPTFIWATANSLLA